ncbi:ABC transporter ATP-binding protein [Erysipelothrix urinaevulpis]|uniref:ABC transporter ATP-binding protein n=1 Tax=Erysipelothrix urinaevulpis TaxID=2683717 RepID=UPI0013590EA8|nr:ABC transporter ATP-binding protein [Erysipelothrix urinaevulpis]
MKKKNNSLYKYLKPDIKIAILGVSFVIGSALIELYQIQLMSEIIDVGIQQSNLEVILRVGGKMIGLALLGAGIGMLGLIYPSKASNNFALRLREDLYDKIQTFSIKNKSRFSTATLVTRLTNDVNFLQRTLMMSLRMLVRAPVFLLSTVVLTYMTSPQLSWVMLVAVFVLSLILFYVVQQGFPRFTVLQTKVDALNKKIQESLINIRVIKSFVREDYEDDNFETENQDLYEASVRANILMALMSPALMAAINFSSILVMYISSHLIVNVGMLQVGDLLVFINYLRFTMFSMMMITHVLMMLSRSRASSERIKAVLAVDIDIESLDESIEVNHDDLTIKFNDVSFKYYEDAEAVLKNLNFTVNQGDRLGIIGSTGSGKTSLINLLVRLVDVSSGSVTINDVDVRDIDLKELRDLFGFVPQNNVLFSGTIRDNLYFGNRDASDDTLVKASSNADIYEHIRKLPKRFDDPVQQGGTNFSGGQKQRLTIARALVKEAPVLVLDDSTSALDAATEMRVKENIDKSYPTMTIISIAQKISSVIDSDQILVLDKGEIVGQGTHTELMKTCNVYQEIYDSQMSKGGLE